MILESDAPAVLAELGRAGVLAAIWRRSLPVDIVEALDVAAHAIPAGPIGDTATASDFVARSLPSVVSADVHAFVLADVEDVTRRVAPQREGKWVHRRRYIHGAGWHRDSTTLTAIVAYVGAPTEWQIDGRIERARIGDVLVFGPELVHRAPKTGYPRLLRLTVWTPEARRPGILESGSAFNTRTARA